jgi:hypothetical protein
MTNNYQENQNRLVDIMKATQSFKDTDPFTTNYERRNAFEDFMSGPDSIPNCGCGDPNETLIKVLDALNLCALKGTEERKTFTQEKFGVDYVTSDGLVQLLFYVLDDKEFIQHGGGVGYSWLSDAGKVFRALLDQYLNEPDAEQLLNWDFEIDFDVVLAAD